MGTNDHLYDRKATDRMHDQIENAYCATVPPLEKGRKVASSVKKAAIKGDGLNLTSDVYNVFTKITAT